MSYAIAVVKRFRPRTCEKDVRRWRSILFFVDHTDTSWGEQVFCVVLVCLARHSERGKKTRQTVEEVGRQHQGMDRPGVRQVPEGSGKQGKMEETGCEIVCGAPTTLTVKG